MTVKKCDQCKGEVSVRPYWMVMRGRWGERNVAVDAEATIDLCDECARTLSNAIEANDTHVRAAQS